MMLSSILTAAACLAVSVVAQTPPGYTWATSNSPLYLKYHGFPIFPAGSVLPYHEPTYEPSIYASSPLNGTYLLFFVDSNYNESSPIPAELLWIASGVTFSQTPTAVVGQKSHVYRALTFNSSRVPYLAPTVPGHTYIALIYNSPPNFAFPPNFPYSATVRANFNVTRIGADFHSPAVEATYFTIAGKHTHATGTAGVPHPTGTGASGTHATGYGPTGTGAYGAYGTGYGLTARMVPLTGGANAMSKVVETWWATLAAYLSTVAVMATL